MLEEGVSIYVWFVIELLSLRLFTRICNLMTQLHIYFITTSAHSQVSPVK